MFICLLRGINVNGIKIKNSDLKAVFETIGFTDVTLVLQTGNVIYNTDLDLASQKKVIEDTLGETFNYDAFVIVRDAKAMQYLIDDYPFDLSADMQPYVIFVNSDDIIQDLLKLPRDVDEFVQLGNNVVYWTVRKGMTLDSKFGKALGKKQYKSETTTRNLRTIEKIVAKIK
ncbi:DUF1697 domain-containing protein [Macrococcoides caseolyticum]|uniref:DUF1697 domain-containing protein n=1 Tax=Macrococcoides caseolyticum TaxID=69966 RepID=UPI001F1D4C02|nr:DUF1697 domain-containing protein [Macrococcus caseolyticus]MCE4955953.1 DUF1697 domain-containing protein [Macrococcus caseolyticus]